MQAYEPLAITPGSNGSIYSSGVVAANNANQIQNNLNQSVSGGKRSKSKRSKSKRRRSKRRRSKRRRSKRRRSKRRRSKRILKGGAEVTGIPVAYNDGGGINNSFASLTELNNQSAANAVGDSLVSKGGTRRSRKRKGRKGRKSRKGRRSRSKKRRSRRHK